MELVLVEMVLIGPMIPLVFLTKLEGEGMSTGSSLSFELFCNKSNKFLLAKLAELVTPVTDSDDFFMGAVTLLASIGLPEIVILSAGEEGWDEIVDVDVDVEVDVDIDVDVVE